MVSEQDFYLLQGNRYRGSRYANFAGAGVDAQGNVSSATNENKATQSAGTAVDPSQAGAVDPTKQASSGLLSSSTSTSGGGVGPAPTAPSLGQTAKNVALGAALPFAGSTIGSAAGASIAGGSTLGEGLSKGVSALTNRVSGLFSTGASAGEKGLVAAAQKANGTAGIVSKGSNIGGSVGSGLGTAAATLLTGGSVKDAAKAGIGSAAGTYIGTAIGGPIGGVVGSFIGSTIAPKVAQVAKKVVKSVKKVFKKICFAEGTPILLEDGTTTKPVEQLRIGDRVLGGGQVQVRGEGLADSLYEYKNTKVTGSHAVFENGVWLRVKDSPLAVKIPSDGVVVYPVGTEQHILITPYFVSADVFDVALPNEEAAYSFDDRIKVLNENEGRNAFLLQIEKAHCNGEIQA